MDNLYKIADITNNTEAINTLSQFEQELSRKLGKDVVLVAYTDFNRV